MSGKSSPRSPNGTRRPPGRRSDDTGRGEIGSSTTGLILLVLAIVVVVIGLAAPAGAMAQYRPAETQAHIGDGAVQPHVTIYDSGCSSWSGAGEAGSCVYDDAATPR